MAGSCSGIKLHFSIPFTSVGAGGMGRGAEGGGSGCLSVSMCVVSLFVSV